MTKELYNEFIIPTYQPSDIVISHGKGSILVDINGKEYVDFASGIGVNSVGYNNLDFTNEIHKQIKKIIHTSNKYYIQSQAECAKKIVELSEYNMKCFFANSGAEANEAAIKIARKYGQMKGKFKIITLENSFHGRTIATLKATGQKNLHKAFGPYPEGFLYAKNLNEVESLIDNKTSAVMIELIQGEGGVYPLDYNDVKRLESQLKKKDILLIVDEVQTGVYRSGRFLASQVYNIEPDIITLAKGLGGGLPIGVVMSSKNILSTGDHGSTFGGNNLSTTAANFILNFLERHEKSNQLSKVSKYFSSKLNDLCERHSKFFLGKVGIGMMYGLKIKNEEILNQIILKAENEGVLLLKSGRSTLRFLPPLTINIDEVNAGFKALENAIFKLKDNKTNNL